MARRLLAVLGSLLCTSLALAGSSRAAPDEGELGKAEGLVESLGGGR